MEVVKVQFFLFGDQQFLPSEILPKMPVNGWEMQQDWDYMLVRFNDGTETAYIDHDEGWMALDDGTNPWGLCFIESVNWLKYEGPYIKFKSLVRQ
jgi:hypothetical protein